MGIKENIMIDIKQMTPAETMLILSPMRVSTKNMTVLVVG